MRLDQRSLVTRYTRSRDAASTGRDKAPCRHASTNRLARRLQYGATRRLSWRYVNVGHEESELYCDTAMSAKVADKLTALDLLCYGEQG